MCQSMVCMACGVVVALMWMACISSLDVIDSNARSETPVNTKTDSDISLWIDEKQVKQFFNGFPLKIYAILDGNVLPYVLDPNLDKYLPTLPFSVSSVNLTWKSGDHHMYSYDFDELVSYNQEILSQPILSIESKGKVPKKAKVFQVFIPCVGNVSGIATFTIGLRIINSETNQNLVGTPLRLKLQKQCADSTPDPECDKKCGNGKCNQNKICECPTGGMSYKTICIHSYMTFVFWANSVNQCMNGGTCVAPGVCSCAQGFQGFYCEGGICGEKCLNGGKCIQKDMCWCRRGYYGPRCEYSKCVIPCLNGSRCVGARVHRLSVRVHQRRQEPSCEYSKCVIPCLNGSRCVGVNRCRCRRGFIGSQCESISDDKNQSSHNHKPVVKKKRKKFV
ncbi:unnamed protein product [Oppiella nova]|uniref:Wnt inhibitory factor 1 n=1 Tax=Oppiella nova TaxID=334625 RepID=A0A7R9M2H5_9ACAR|nr:unnamed protein product [Oppiella nova]CAG2169495.1 unnamed protein product [Oppiella nova]